VFPKFTTDSRTFKNVANLGILVHTYNPSTWEAEAGGSKVPASLEDIAKPCPKKSHKLRSPTKCTVTQEDALEVKSEL
jgi:hypothetical protein